MVTGRRRQRGAALLAAAAIVVLGTTWFVLSTVSSAAARSGAQVAHNARVLAEAKAALIAWVATRALDAAEDNPGRLPCPQAWGDVGSASEGRAAAVCANPIGWLPWRTLGLPRTLDAGGRQLWYVVSPGWHLPNASASLSINSDTAGQLLVDGRRAVALLIAPGAPLAIAPNAAQLAAGCVARKQSHAISLPGAPPNPRDFLECYSGTAFNTAGNDQVVAITAAEFLPALEAAIAKRIERDIVPPLKSVYATADWGLDAAHPVFPFAAPFANPGTSGFRGAAGTFEGLVPFHPVQGFVEFAATPADAVEVLGYGSIVSQSCLWESAEARRCEGKYQGNPTEPWRPIRIEMTASFSNVAMGLRALDASRLQVLARDAAGASAWLPLPVTHTARLESDGSASVTFGAVLPSIAAGQFRIRIERAAIADHALLDAADPASGWFVRNQWHRLVYYAIAPAHAASGTHPRSCALCLEIKSIEPAGRQRAILILAGRSLAGAPRPNGELADFLEGANADAVPGFERRAASASFNDRIVVVDANP